MLLQRVPFCGAPEGRFLSYPLEIGQVTVEKNANNADGMKRYESGYPRR